MHAYQGCDQRQLRGERPPSSLGSLGIAAACLIVLLQACAQPAAGESGVFIASPGRGAIELLGQPAGAPVWAPNGDAIAWATEDGLYRRDITANAPMLLSTRAAAGRPAWSPDGGVLAIVDREAETLVALDAATGETRFELDIATRDARHRPLALPVLGGPAWSPDGTRLAFNCWDGHGDEICVVQSDGSGNIQLTHIQTRRTPSQPPPDAFILASSNAGPPAWSPQGDELALAVYPEQRGAASGVFVVDLVAGRARRVSTLLPNSEIAWFPDGGSLLFSARDQGRSDAFRVPTAAEAGEAKRLTEALTSGAREPALSPDQTRLAVSSGGDVTIIDIQGNVQASIDGGMAHRHPAWRPQGDWIAFEAAPDPLESYS